MSTLLTELEPQAIIDAVNEAALTHPDIQSAVEDSSSALIATFGFVQQVIGSLIEQGQPVDEVQALINTIATGDPADLQPNIALYRDAILAAFAGNETAIGDTELLFGIIAGLNVFTKAQVRATLVFATVFAPVGVTQYDENGQPSTEDDPDGETFAASWLDLFIQKPGERQSTVQASGEQNHPSTYIG